MRSFFLVPGFMFALLSAGNASAAQLELRILDTQGGAVPGATVRLHCGDRAAGMVLSADGSGKLQAECGLPAQVTVTAAGFEEQRLRLDVGSAGVLEIVLRPAPVVTSVDVIVRAEPLAAVSASSALQIERTGARTVLDAVERLVPGAFVTRRGVMGYGIATNGTGAVSIRGVGGSPNTQVLVVVDGRPDVMGLMGHPLPDFYTLSDVGSLRITQGPASVLYGSNAMGGAVEITPTEPEAGFRTRLDSTLGTFWTGMHRLSQGARFERWSYHFGAGVSHTGGDRPSSAFRNQDASLNLGVSLNSNWHAKLSGRYGHFHVEDPGPVSQPLNNSYARVGRGGFSSELQNSYARTSGYVRVYGGYGRHIITDGFRSTDDTTGIRVHQSFQLREDWTAEAGVDHASYGGKARNILTRLDYGEHELDETAGFLRMNWRAARRLALNGGFRRHHHSLYGGLSVPEAGASYWLSQKVAVSAAIARGFRNPTIRELYLFPAPNPALRPESLWNYQATVDARLHPLFQAWAAFYYADLKNQVVTLGRFPNLRLENAGRAINKGIDANLRFRVARPLSLMAGYAWLRSTNLAPLVPTHKWNAASEFSTRRLRATFMLMRVNSRYANVQRTARLKGYTLGSLKADIPLNRRLTLFALADNLFNRKYEVVAGYPMPGINGLAGITVSF